jgi:hypothetical protein
MIKNLKTRLMVLFTACTLALCGGLSFVPPFTAYAEETLESVESVETPETSIALGEKYTFTKDGVLHEVEFAENKFCVVYAEGVSYSAEYNISKSGIVYIYTQASIVGIFTIQGNELIDYEMFPETPETSEENAEISSEIERPTWLQQVYIHEEDKDHVARITLVDEECITLEVIYKGNVSGTIYGEYWFIKGDVIEIWANGEWFADMQLFPNGTFDYYDEETPVVPELPNNGENTDEELTDSDKLTKEEVAGIVKQAYEKAKNWVANTYAWIIGIGGGGVLTLLLSIFWKLIGSKINRTNNLTEEKVEKIAENSSEKTVQKIVGKSLNVDIQSEVSNSVKNELLPMIQNSELAMQSAKNAEVGTALVMKAVAKSRLISEEETKAMEDMADSLLAHAEKYGGLSVPIQIQTEMKEEEPAPVKESVNLVETPNKPKEKKENESYISF